MGARDELTTCRAAVGASVAHTSRNEVSEGMLLPAAPRSSARFRHGSAQWAT